jgi:hypothetical protein
MRDWISVKEWLPPISKTYICHGKRKIGGTFVSLFYFSEITNQFEFIIPNLFYDEVEITHWMELPDSPDITEEVNNG